MPTYEYQCKSCKHAFEKMQKITEQPLAKCPKCGGVVEKLISGGIGFILKGAGGCFAQDGMSPQCGANQSCCGSSPMCGQMPCHME